GTTADDIGSAGAGLVATSSFNLIGTGGAGGLADGVNHNQVGVSNPGLGTLADNGGPTKTGALLPRSPAPDAGDDSLADAAGLTTDQRGTGFDRFSGTVDIGAFEFDHPLDAVIGAFDLKDGVITNKLPLTIARVRDVRPDNVAVQAGF